MRPASPGAFVFRGLVFLWGQSELGGCEGSLIRGVKSVSAARPERPVNLSTIEVRSRSVNRHGLAASRDIGISVFLLPTFGFKVVFLAGRIILLQRIG